MADRTGRCGQTAYVRIVLVVPGGVDPVGPRPDGTERAFPFLHGLVEHLSVTTGHEVLVVAVGHDPLPGRWRLFGADVVNVPIGVHARADVARAVRDVVRLSGEGGRPDVVHGWWAGATGLAAVVAARWHRRPSVVSLAGGELADVAAIGYGGARSRGSRAIATIATRGATVVTAATRWMADHAAARGVCVDEVIPLGADRRVFAPHVGIDGVTGRADSVHAVIDLDGGGHEDAVPGRVVQIGSLNAVKDQATSVRMLAELRRTRPDAHLVLIGEDTQHGRVAQLAADLGVADAVRCTGCLPSSAVAAEVRRAQLHLVTSFHEAGPVGVVEAAAVGVPTLGTAVGHVADLAAASPPAAVAVDVPARDALPRRLADEAARLLADDERRHAIATAARTWATAHDADATGRAFEALYRRLAARA